MASKKVPPHLRKKRGRPTKYREEFHPEDFIRLSKLGKTSAQICLEWDVDPDLISDWSKRHPEFLRAVKKGRVFAEAWYVNLGQAAMVGQATYAGTKINPNLGFYCWLTKNMFKWSDRIHTEEKKNPEDFEDPLPELSDEELDQA